MNKQLYSVAVVVGLSVVLPVFCGQKNESEKDKLLRLLTSTHTLVFSKDNLLTERIKPEDSNKWYDLLGSMRAFVNKKASDLNPQFEQLWIASADLLNTLKVLYGSQFSKKPLNLNTTFIEQQLETLKAQQQKVQTVLDAMNKKPRGYERDRHAEAREVVKNLALFLDATYAKVPRDYRKIVPAN
ncbi:MAG: hypothetical protein ACHQVS_04745 [Candidatus Babeliales bacterium]